MNQSVFLAPIVLFVYNRSKHTCQTLEALLANELAAESDLFIYSDGPKRPEDEAEVLAVRELIKGVDGFNSVTIIEREHNLGLTKSIILGVTEIVNRFGRIIVLEDDIVTSPYFLQFMNDALSLYENKEQVVAIQGYTFPLGIPLPDTFFLHHTGCWGWGTWRRGWALFDPDGEKHLEALKKSQLTTSFDHNGAYPFTKMLQNQVTGKIDTWDILWYASTFINQGLNLYPGGSLVKNIGLDGSGVHCGKSTFYDVPLLERRVDVRQIPVKVNHRAVGNLEAYFRTGHSGFIRYWLWKLFGKGMS